MNSRFLLEQDQLLKRLVCPVKERLAILEAHRELIPDRYALMLAYVSMLNADGQYEKALDLMMHLIMHNIELESILRSESERLPRRPQAAGN